MPARQIPNPTSMLLANSVVGGVGLGPVPQPSDPPPEMAALVLYVPMGLVIGKSAIEIQADLGIPWLMIGGKPFWFDGN